MKKKTKLTPAGRKFLKSLRVGMIVEFDFRGEDIRESMLAFHGYPMEILQIKYKLEDNECYFVRGWNEEIVKHFHGGSFKKETFLSGWVNLNWLRYPILKDTQLELFREKEIYQI